MPALVGIGVALVPLQGKGTWLVWVLGIFLIGRGSYVCVFNSPAAKTMCSGFFKHFPRVFLSEIKFYKEVWVCVCVCVLILSPVSLIFLN